MKLFYFDLETTGTKFWKNGIHEISGIIEIDGEIKEIFSFHVQPNPQAEIEHGALDVGGVTLEQINAYKPMGLVYLDIIKMLNKYVDKFDKKDKFYLVGYNNAVFDNAFFRAFFVQNNDNYFGSYFWSHSIDVMVLATCFLLKERSEMKDFKLKTVAEYLGIKIEEERLHLAAYDLEITREIYLIVASSPYLKKN